MVTKKKINQDDKQIQLSWASEGQAWKLHTAEGEQRQRNGQEGREGEINEYDSSKAGKVRVFQVEWKGVSACGWKGAFHSVHPSDIPDWGAEQNPLTAFQLTGPGKPWKLSVVFPKDIN